MRNLIIANVETLSHESRRVRLFLQLFFRRSTVITHQFGGIMPPNWPPMTLAPLWIRHRRQCTGTGKYRPRL